MEELTITQRKEKEEKLRKLLELVGKMDAESLGNYLLEKVEEDRVINEQLKKDLTEKVDFYKRKKFLLEIENFALILTNK